MVWDRMVVESQIKSKTAMTIEKIKNRLRLANVTITTQQAQAIAKQEPQAIESILTTMTSDRFSKMRVGFRKLGVELR